MLDFISGLFAADFLPHGVCYRWSPGVVWLHVVSDLLIALAYYFIPFALIHIVRSRRDLVFPWMFWLFGVFILACGTTHLMNIWVIWNPVYRLDGVVKLLTAIASVPTAILLLRLAPAVIALPSPEQLREANTALGREVSERTAAEAQVRELNAHLERRVAERTLELQQANERLRESEMRMQAILDTTPAIVYVKDLEGRYGFVNSSFQHAFTSEQNGGVRGLTDYDIFPKADADAFRQADRTVIETKAPVEVEEVTHRNSESRTYMSVKFPLFDASGQPYAVCGMSTDITDRKNAEHALQKYNAELEEFAYIVAHDLQEPLRTVKSYSQLLARRYAPLLDEDGHVFLGYITGGAQRMGELVNDLQSYTEVAVRRLPDRTACDLNKILRDTKSNLDAAITESQAKIVSQELPVVFANPRQMTQLFQNLLSNAIKYRSKSDLIIEISATREAHEWVFRVTDNGIGIEPRYRQQIFGVFKRLHGREIPGTGVGLAICRQIVEQHQGRIWADQSASGGSTFLFTLPA